jgi:hypothetical protein
VASTPSLPRRRKRKLTEIDLAARLRKYEHLLKSHGVKIEDEDTPQEADEPRPKNKSPDHFEFKLLSMNAPSPRNLEGEGGALFTDKGNSHFVEK